MYEQVCLYPECENESEELISLAERWLKSNEIKTRTEYGNLLSAYNLLLEIGKYLKRRY